MDAMDIEAELDRIEHLPLDERAAALEELERQMRASLEDDAKE